MKHAKNKHVFYLSSEARLLSREQIFDACRVKRHVPDTEAGKAAAAAEKKKKATSEEEEEEEEAAAAAAAVMVVPGNSSR